MLEYILILLLYLNSARIVKVICISIDYLLILFLFFYTYYNEALFNYVCNLLHVKCTPTYGIFSIVEAIIKSMGFSVQ